jgi:formate dehydrogenase subunit gamma
MALCVLVLMATAFLPILGIDFAWVGIHWSTGLVLAVLVLAHSVRSLIAKSIKSMWIGRDDLVAVVDELRWNLRLTSRVPGKPGKYSLAQKLIHHAFAVVVLTTIVTGFLMLAKIDTPLWERNPYLLSDPVWGIVYVLHGLAALLLITMIISHVYFAFRPEKLHFLRSMLLGWITRREFELYHDPDRWQA